MAFGDVYYAKWKFNDVSLGVLNVPGIHIRQQDVSFNAANVAERMVRAWNTYQTGGLKTLYVADMRLDAILIRRVKPLEPIEQVITTSLPIAGTAAGDETAPGVSPLVSWRTPNIGRSYRGRTYLPAPAESVQDVNGVLSVANAQRVADIMVDLMADLNDAFTLTPVTVWSPTLNLDTLVTQVKVDRRLRSQRRRQVEQTLYVTGV